MSTTKLKFGLAALVIAGTATILVVQRQSQISLREENESLRQQIAEIKTDNEGLANSVVQARAASSLRSNQLRELLRLRGEVGVLRRQQRELDQAVAAARTKEPVSTPQVEAVSQPNQLAPFQVQLVLDEAGDDSEILTNNAGPASGQVMHVRKTPLLDYTAINSVDVTTDPSSGTSQINIDFSEEGKELFAQVTKENINKRLAIVLDGRLYSAPVIRSEISDGKSQITGSFTEEEARALAAKINDVIKRK
ncbi:MAG: hypothetical protein ABI651_12000 [Verrucomicrobiota bacterium]